MFEKKFYLQELPPISSIYDNTKDKFRFEVVTIMMKLFPDNRVQFLSFNYHDIGYSRLNLIRFHVFPLVKSPFYYIRIFQPSSAAHKFRALRAEHIDRR